MTFLGLVLITLLSPLASARDYFIQATGINPTDKNQNYTEFYTESKNFLTFCEQHPSTQCKLFINSRKDLSQEAIASHGFPPTITSPNTVNVLNEFKLALQQAKPGDQVVLSLSNHGGPGKIEASCIYMDNKDKICTDDIAALLKDYKKPGVRVFVSAFGCFSGGFSKLSTNEVCTRTTASQTKEGFATDENLLWTSIQKGSPSAKKSSLQQYSIRAPQLDGTEPLLGSQFILNQQCDDVRKTLKERHLVFTTDLLAAVKLASPMLCPVAANPVTETNLQQLHQSMDFVSTQKSNLLSIQKNLCQKMTATNTIFCSSLNNLLSPNLPAKTEAQKISKIYELNLRQQKSIEEKIFELVEQRKMARLAAGPKAELRKRKAHPEFYLGSNWKGLNADLDELLSYGLTLEISNLDNKISDLLKTREQIPNQIAEQIKKLDAQPALNEYVEDLSNVSLCLRPGFQEPTLEEKKYLNRNYWYKYGIENQRHFTPKDFQDAKACEKSFYL